VQFISQILEHPSLLAYFSGANNYTWLQFRNGERRLLAKPLTYFEDRLPEFIRIHKTALINPACVASIHYPPRPKMPGTVQMQDGNVLPVSRRRWNEVAQLLHTQISDALTSTTVLAVNGSAETAEGQTTAFPYTSPPLVMQAVMTGDALLLTHECIEAAKIPCLLKHSESGNALANALMMNPLQDRPALILLDARTNRSDRMLALRSLKNHPRLRSIPVVWLAAPGDDTMQAYTLDANSVVVVPDGASSFSRIIEQLCRYWLMIVQLPPEANAL
jgi:CheY-like chemotaxis protein